MAAGSSHEVAGALLGPYVLDALQHGERREVEEHLAVCSSCQEVEARLRHTATQLRSRRLESSSALWHRIEGLVRQPEGMRPPA